MADPEDVGPIAALMSQKCKDIVGPAVVDLGDELLAFAAADRPAVLPVCILILALTGCSASTGSGGLEEGDARFPNLTEVKISLEGDGAYTFDVTISSPYDSAERYADGWRVLGEDGEEYATMELGHDHASEQPFTRSQSGVKIPAGVTTVEIEGHDTANGYGGDTVTVEVPTR